MSAPRSTSSNSTSPKVNSSTLAFSAGAAFLVVDFFAVVFFVVDLVAVSFFAFVDLVAFFAGFSSAGVFSSAGFSSADRGQSGIDGDRADHADHCLSDQSGIVQSEPLSEIVSGTDRTILPGTVCFYSVFHYCCGLCTEKCVSGFSDISADPPDL